MRISDVEVLLLAQEDRREIADSTQDAVLIRIITDDGIVGIGECDASPQVIHSIMEAPRSHALSVGLRELLVGQDPLMIEMLWDKMYHGSIFFGRRGAAIMAMSGVDLALYDIAGKSLDVPAHVLLGGARRSWVRAYASTLMPATPEAAATEARELVAEGYTAIKFGWGPLGRSADLDISLVKAVRSEVGDDIDILLDVGFGWKNYVHATRQIERLAEVGVYLIEEPLRPDDLGGYRRLRESSTIPIAFGEENTTRFEFAQILDNQCADIIQPDVTRCGGLTEAKRISIMADMHGVPCVPHAWSTGIVQAATAHLNAVLPEALFLEHCVRDSDLNRELVTNPLCLQDGGVVVPTEPGLGIELNEAVIDRLAVPV